MVNILGFGLTAFQLCILVKSTKIYICYIEYVNILTWLFSNRTSFTKAASGSDFGLGYSLITFCKDQV